MLSRLKQLILKRLEWRFNITARMLGLFLVAGILPLLLLGITAFHTSKRIVIQQAETENTRLLSALSSYLRLYNDQIEDLASNIAGNSAVGLTLRRVDEEQLSAFNNLEVRTQMGFILNSYVRVKGLVSIDVFSRSGAHFHVGETLNVSGVEQLTTHTLLQETSKTNTPVLWRGIHTNLNKNSEIKKVNSITRSVQHFSPETGKSDVVGLLVININNEIMHRFLENVQLAPGMQLMQLDRNGNITLHSDPSRFAHALTPGLLQLIRAKTPIQRFVLDGEDVLMNVTPTDNQQRSLVIITPYKLLTQKVDQLAFATMGLIVLGLFGVIALTWYFARTVVVPIRSVSTGFRLLEKDLQGEHKHLPEQSIPDEIGQLVQGFNNYLDTLQAQRLATEELRYSEEIRHKSENMLMTAIEAIDEAFALFDADDHLVLCNQRYRDLYPSCQDVVVIGASFTSIMNAIARRGLIKAAIGREEEWLAECLEQHQAGVSTQIERLMDGRVMRVAEKKMPDGYIVGFKIDITELLLATEAAQEAADSKSRFLANMSHEIRTPLNAILGFSAILQDEVSDRQQREYIGLIQAAGDALLSQINDVLDFSKIEAGKLDIEHIDFDVRRTLEDSIDLVANKAYEKNLELACIFDPLIPVRLCGDPSRIRQIMLNLLNNAIKFTSAGEIVVRVRAEKADSTHYRLVIAIKDSGAGISQEIQHKLFQPFTQADSSTTRHFGGTGLGLSICKRLSEAMNGHIEVSSQPGKGATFQFDVLLGKAEIEERQTILPANLHNKRILVIDRFSANRELLNLQLTSIGLEVEAFADVPSAMARIQTGHPFALAIVDHIESGRAIHAHPAAASLPLGLLTAIRQQGQTDRVKEAGFSFFITQPIHTSQLCESLAEAFSLQIQPQTNCALVSTPHVAGLHKKPYVLLVEDNLINQKVAVLMLEKLNCRVDIVSDGLAGVHAVELNHYDAVFMDCQMPIMDGFMATKTIRAMNREEMKKLPIIALTANAYPEDSKKCYAAGMNDFLSKPVNIETLKNCLDKWLTV